MTRTNDLSSSRWRSAPQSEFEWRQYGIDFIAFHRPSGKTHYLNDASERLLTSILLEPIGIEKIAVEFTQAGNGGDELVDELTEMLEHFEELGLVERL